MALQFELAGSQIDGTRGYQEDAFLITHLADENGDASALVIVADGMGGHAAGNVASNMAVQAFNKHVSANYPTEDHATILRECIEMANNSIKEIVAETPALAGMGCTMVAAILEKGHIWWASIGDSHVYLLRNKELIKKNADHSYGGFLDRMESAGTPVEPEPGLARNMLMSAIIGDDLGEVDVPEEPFALEPGDKILICSDGMDTLSAGKIIQFSDWSETPKGCADDLLQAVEDTGMPKQDNTTIVVVNVTESQEAAAEPEPEPAPAEAVATEEHTDTPPTRKLTQEISTEEIAEAEQKGSKTGMFIGIAAVVIIGIAAAAFMSMGDKAPAPTPSSEEIADVVLEEDEVLSEEDIENIADDAEEEDGETVAASEETVEPAPAPVTAKPATSSSKEFQDTLKDGSAGPVMVRIAKGEFDMGSSNSSRHADERPRHLVNVRRFSVSKNEITFAEYEKFAQAKGRRIPDNLYMDKATHPVVFVSWDDAYYYTKWLSKQTGQRYRLPTESEWEYIAGTGKRSPFWWGYNEEPNRAHCFGCGSGLDPRKPTKVGSFGANDFGIYDTAGNVAEWVHDCWHENYKDAPSDSGVWEGGDCAYRIARGGAYSSPPQSIRHAKRDKFKSDQMYDHIGIRIVRDPE